MDSPIFCLAVSCTTVFSVSLFLPPTWQSKPAGSLQGASMKRMVTNDNADNYCTDLQSCVFAICRSSIAMQPQLQFYGACRRGSLLSPLIPGIYATQAEANCPPTESTFAFVVKLNWKYTLMTALDIVLQHFFL